LGTAAAAWSAVGDAAGAGASAVVATAPACFSAA
jgi:hypothetical protein